MRNKYFAVLLILCLVATFAGPQTSKAQEPITITILETADIHGHIYNWDFFGSQEYDQGIAIVSTIVKQERELDADLLLLDAGDTIQGTPLTYYYNVKEPDEINPMAVVMNAMDYDAMTVGNHEYNYGQGVLDKFIQEVEFPIMSANIYETEPGDKYTPYIIKEVQGVQVGILALTTVGIPVWEKPEHIENLTFADAIETAETFIPQMKEEGATVIVVLAHSSTHVEPADTKVEGAWMSDHTDWVDKGYADEPGHNFTIKLAEAVPEIDVILSGHSHLTIPQAMINGVLLVEPYRWGRGVSKVTLQIDADGAVVDKTGEFLSASEVKPDPEILDLAKPYQDGALAYVSSEVGTAEGDFPGGYEARWKDGPLADFINAVQLEMAEEAGYPADISLAALFNNTGQFIQGPITIADVYGIYQYDNTLYVLEITGDILKQALEHDAKYWGQYDPDNPPSDAPEGLLAGNVRDYNWDMYTGIDYKIDISQPEGERVVELTYQGQDVEPDQTFVLAINNYRGGGGGGYSMFAEGAVLWKSMSEIRDYMAEYIQDQGTLDPQDYFVENWSLLPASVYEEQSAQSTPEPTAEPVSEPATLPVSGDSAQPDFTIVILLLLGGSLAAFGIYMRRPRTN